MSRHCQEANKVIITPTHQLTIVSFIVDEPSGGVVPATLCTGFQFHVQLLLLLLSLKVLSQHEVFPNTKQNDQYGDTYA